MMIVGFIVVGLALFVEFTFHPPYWVHAVIWVPLVLGLSIGLLRPLKGLMIAQQYKHRAELGKLDENAPCRVRAETAIPLPEGEGFQPWLRRSLRLKG